MKKGEKAEILGAIEVTKAETVSLGSITAKDCKAEGFPRLKPEEFIEVFTSFFGKPPGGKVRRIEFKYLDYLDPEKLP